MQNLRMRSIGLIAAGSLILFSTGCPDDDVEEYEVELAGENQVPPVATPASGTMDVEFDEEDETLRVEGDFDGLVSRLIEIEGSAAHIHFAPQGESGPILWNVDVDADEDERGGSFEFERELTADEVETFQNNEMYLNIHTQAYPDGELRGQLDEGAPTFASIDQSWGVELTPEAHVHAVDTEAQGWAWAILRDDDTMVVSGAADNLSSAPTDVFGSAVNIEEAPQGEVGDLVLNLDYETIDDTALRFWQETTLDEDQIEVLRDGGYYINLYTDEQEAGELRGQLDEEDDFFQEFWEDIFDDDPDRIDEVPPF